MGHAVTTGGLRQRRHPDLALAQRLAAAARVTETAPLLSRLRRAALAARLALRVSSAASWLHSTGLLGLSVGAAVEDAVVQGTGAGARAGAEGSSATTTVGPSGLPGLVRPIPVHPATAAAAAAAPAVAPATSMIGRLRARAGLTPTVIQRTASPHISNNGSGKRNGGSSDNNGDGFGHDCAAGGASDGGEAPVAVLIEMTLLLRDLFEADGEEEFGETERLLGSGPGKSTEDGRGPAIFSLVEKGLAAVAYRYICVCHVYGVLWVY